MDIDQLNSTATVGQSFKAWLPFNAHMNWRIYLVKPGIIPVAEHSHKLTKCLNLKYLRFSSKQHMVLLQVFLQFDIRKTQK